MHISVETNNAVHAIVNPSIFREYDIRGLAEVDFAGDSLEQLALGLCSWYRERGVGTMLLAHDCRTHSPRIMESIARVMLRHGMHVLSIGHCTTPCFYHACHHLEVDAGIMVTASHNPAPDNGLKLMLGKETLYGASIQEIREKAVWAQDNPAAVPGERHNREHIPAYCADLREKIALGPRKLKVVVDCGNGSTGPLADLLFSVYQDQLDIIPLFFQPDGTFPNHEADPVKPQNLVWLQQRVLEEQADVGIAFDGDGDRLGVVDEQGNVIWGDMLMVLFWREIMPKHPGSIGLVEVKCSQLLYDEIAKLGGKPEFCKTGHSLIKARMRETNAVFTGEMSGHIFFADEYYGFDDALYSALRLLRILSNTEQPLSTMLSDLPTIFNTPEVRIPCPDAEKFAVVQALCSKLGSQFPVVQVDGVRVVFPEGWGLFRASNTQAALVARCEATSAEKLDEYMGILNAVYSTVQPGQTIAWFS